LAQLVFGLASYVSPLVFESLMQRAAAGQSLVWVAFYRDFVAVFVMLVLLSAWLAPRRVALTESERVGTAASYRELLRERSVWLFFVGIFTYVGTEQSLNNWMSTFLKTYHGFSPNSDGAHAVALFWGLMSIGCLLGLLLLRLADSKLVLALFTVAALVSLTL